MCNLADLYGNVLVFGGQTSYDEANDEKTQAPQDSLSVYLDITLEQFKERVAALDATRKETKYTKHSEVEGEE